MKENRIIKYTSTGLITNVEKAIGITNKLICTNTKPLNIIYLDDHFIFSKSVGGRIVQKFPCANIKYFKDGTNALAYVLQRLYKSEKIDLIITDLTHPGVDGLSFSKLVREKESSLETKIPLLFITMHNDRSIVDKIEAIPFSKYLSKGAGWGEINLAIENIL